MAGISEILTVDQFNALPEPEAFQVLKVICGSQTWQEAMLAGLPYASVADLDTMAGDLWSLTDEHGLIDAFNGYVQVDSQGDYRKLFPDAFDDVIKRIIEQSIQYSAKFGFSFVANDAGLSADDFLSELNQRLLNHRGDELDNAANALGKVIKRKINAGFIDQASNLRFLISDMSFGKPAQGVAASLFSLDGALIAKGFSDEQGVLSSWTAPVHLAAGQYHLQCDTAAYFQASQLKTLYPSVVIHFEIIDSTQLCHMQMSISPFGYSTGLLP